MSKIVSYLYGHVSAETAYLVEDYPWGFRLRTQQRHWIESIDKSTGGERHCVQTMDPRTGKWCAVKKSTYSDICILALDEQGHVTSTCLRMNIYRSRDDKLSLMEYLDAFYDRHIQFLTDFQKSQFIKIKAYNRVMEHVTFTCKEGVATDEDEAKNRRVLGEIHQLMVREANNMVL
jgi:hypothetical protein